MPPLAFFLTKPASFILHHRRFLFALPLILLCEIAVHIYHYRITPPPTRLDAPFYTGCQNTSAFESQPRENATILMLARNSDLEGAVSSIVSLEKSFNAWAKYPITFLNDEPWQPDFMDAVKEVSSGEVQFGVIDANTWNIPPHIPLPSASAALTAQGDAGILYGNSTSYHNMCRYLSAPFASHPLLARYAYYWRLEPSVRYTCRLTYDPFTAMRAAGKKYGYILALWEIPETAPSLYAAVSDYKRAQKIHTGELWRAFTSRTWWLPWPVRGWVLGGRAGYNNEGDKWNWCHFWSNFEIASLDFFRSEEVRGLFEFLDRRGGFYYERWGDAPVHSLAAALLLKPEEVHHFADWGYVHLPFQYCPYEVKGGGGVAPDLSKMAESEAVGLGCDCVCDDTTVVRPVCLNRIKETVL